MFKQNIVYTDFNGNERDEDFYFHLSTPELTRVEASIGGPLDEYAQRIAGEQNLDKLLDFIENLILKSYGKKTMDGKSFQKSKELREEFEYSQAYAELFEMMVKDTDLARKFGEQVAATSKSKQKKNQVDPEVLTLDD